MECQLHAIAETPEVAFKSALEIAKKIGRRTRVLYEKVEVLFEVCL